MVTKAFAKAGLPPPVEIWQPDTSLLGNRIFDTFHDICNLLSQGRVAIPDDSLELARFGFMQDWMNLIAPTEDGGTYRCEHFGKGVARVRDMNLQDRTTQEFYPCQRVLQLDL